MLAQGQTRPRVAQAFLRQVFPAAIDRIGQGFAHRSGAFDRAGIAFVEGTAVAVNQGLHHARGRHAGQVGAARRTGQRQTQADNVMRRIADHCLVEVANLDFRPALGVGQWPEIARMAVAADPHRGALRHFEARRIVEPFVEFLCRAANEGMGRSGHFQVAALGQRGRAFIEFAIVATFHLCPPWRDTIGRRGIRNR